LLALFFLRRYVREMGRPVSGFAAETLQLLQQYAWPGNIRELQNIIERGVLFCSGDQFTPEELPVSLQGAVADSPRSRANRTELGKPLPELLEDVESGLIHQAMIQARGVQAQAARLLGISRSNLQYKLRKYGMMSD
jgi:DNA-binding NtrC family response regulator